MVKLYGLDLTTADQFLLTPEEGTMPGEGLRFKPEVMLTDDVAASFADPNQDWADAVDEDGNPYVDPMSGNIRLTFDYSALSNEQEAGDDGRAVQSGSLYRLNVTGLCSTLNYTFSTSGFLDRERLEEWIEANPSAAAQQQRSASSRTVTAAETPAPALRATGRRRRRKPKERPTIPCGSKYRT